MTTQSKTAKPMKFFRLGSVTASVWENGKGDKKFYSVSIARSYKDGEDFKQTSSFGASDLPVVAKLADAAADYILSLTA